MNNTAAVEIFPWLANEEWFMTLPGNCSNTAHDFKVADTTFHAVGMGDLLAMGVLGVYVNAVVTYCKGGVQAGSLKVSSDGRATISGEVYGSDALVGYTTMSNIPMHGISEFLNKFWWGSSTKTALNSKYGKYLAFRKTPIKDEPLPPSDDQDLETEAEGYKYDIEYQSGRLTPYEYTYNYSNTYDVGEAIPSGETITNGYVADRWYGAYAYKRMKRSKTYRLKYEAKYETYDPVSTVQTSTGQQTIYAWKEHSKTVAVETTRTASFYAITACNIYELQTVSVQNGSYDVLTYNSDYGTLAVDCKINGEFPKSSQQSYIPKDDYHAKFAESDPNRTYDSEYYGRVSSAPSDQSIKDHFQSSADNESTLTVTAINDKLVVDGHTYMDEYPQTDHTTATVHADPNGAHPTSDKLYKPTEIILDDDNNLDNGQKYASNSTIPRDTDGDFGPVRKAEQTTTIPSTKANGSYATTLKVTYQSRIPDNGNRTDNGNIKGQAAILPTPNVDQEDLKNYRQNEPVIVHTPVVSNVTIENTDGTDAGENKTQLVNAPDNVVSVKNEDGNKQKKTLAKLRLDGTYQIEFNVYQWLSEKLDSYIEERVNYLADEAYNNAYDAAINNKQGEDAAKAAGQTAKDNLLAQYENAKKSDSNLQKSDNTQTRQGQYAGNPNGDFYDGYYEPGYDASLYDEYVRKKEVRFPFDVAVIDPTTGDETYLSVNSSTGYTDWYNISSIDGYTVKFYIPSWAKESTTAFPNGEKDSEGFYNGYQVQLRVTAYNAPSDTTGLEEDAANREVDKYVATFNSPVNVSGWIYNFQIVGTNDKDMFAGYDSNATAKTDYSFALNKEEKKSGTTNRLGGDYVRYTLDDTVTNNWSKKNIAPTHPASKGVEGSSDIYSNMGVFWKGTTFSYSVKTIANLAETEDKIVIKPTLKFYDGDLNYIGSTADDSLKVYYSDDSGDYIEFGSDRDTNNKKTVSLSSDQFDGSWLQGLGDDSFLTSEQKSKLPSGYSLDNEFKYTADKYSLSTEELLNRKTESYSLSNIVLNPEMRLYTGNSDQLARNMERVCTDAGYDNTPRSNASEDTYRKSMQTWYGQYTIPDKLYVTTKTELEKAVGGDVDGDNDIDLKDYAYKNNLSDSSEIWHDTGYIVINFDIETINNGVDHLIYNGGNNTNEGSNMWETESQIDKVTLPKQKPNEGTGTADTDPVYGTGTIDLDSGDVAIVDMRYSLSDKYSAHIFMIN